MVLFGTLPNATHHTWARGPGPWGGVSKFFMGGVGFGVPWGGEAFVSGNFFAAFGGEGGGGVIRIRNAGTLYHTVYIVYKDTIISTCSTITALKMKFKLGKLVQVNGG